LEYNADALKYLKSWLKSSGKWMLMVILLRSCQLSLNKSLTLILFLFLYLWSWPLFTMYLWRTHLIFKQHSSPHYWLKNAGFPIRTGCPLLPRVQLLKVHVPTEVKRRHHHPSQAAGDHSHNSEQYKITNVRNQQVPLWKDQKHNLQFWRWPVRTRMKADTSFLESSLAGSIKIHWNSLPLTQ
jgi:hypothetical protein